VGGIAAVSGDKERSMETRRNVKYGVDLITVYDPAFWGLTEFNDFYDKSILPPKRFWDRALDTIAEAGIDGIEVTFGPGHWRNALERYGSPKAFNEALASRGLELCSGFNADLVINGGWHPGDDVTELLDNVASYADFLQAAGCEIMIAGLPLRRSWNAEPPMFVDMAYAQELAGVINRMGYTAAKHGVKLAIHPETHAVLWFKRDIDLFMALTDPVYVWFCPDTCHITLGGGDPIEITRAHKERLLICHWKDARGRVEVKYPIDENIFKSHHPYMAQVGLGEVDWKGFMRLLRDVRFQGWAILELDAGSNPPAVMKGGVEFVRNTLLGVYS
jgi:sugar phosphate isomerase/epimerase